jgi:hypothetical protein
MSLIKMSPGLYCTSILSSLNGVHAAQAAGAD